MWNSVPWTALPVIQGASWSHIWLVPDVSGQAIDLTSGYFARGQVRKRRLDTQIVYEFSSDANNTQLTGLGQVIWQLTPTETAALTLSRYVWDLFLTDPAGVVTRIDAGELIVSPDVTRTA